MFDRFTERARKSFSQARKEAQRLNHDYIGTEHMLLGLVDGGDSGALEVLTALGVDPASVSMAIDSIVRPGTRPPVHGQIPFTPRGKRVLELSLEAAQDLGHDYIGTEHLLLGLVLENEGIAAQVLLRLGVKAADVRREVAAIPAAVEGGPAALPSAAPPETPPASPAPPAKVASAAPPPEFGTDLVATADDGPDPSIGRVAEIDRLVVALSGLSKASVLLVGEPGVGRAAIVSGLARRIATGGVPAALAGVRLVHVDVVRMLAGAEFRGQFESRIQSLLGDAARRRDVLWFDDLRLLLGTSSLLGERIDFATMLKPYLARSPVRAIAAATPQAEASCREADPALLRLFRVLRVESPSADDTLAILESQREAHELHYNVRYAHGVLGSIVELARLYMPDRSLPDAVIDLLDEAGARVRFRDQPAAPSTATRRARLRELEAAKQAAIATQAFEEAAAVHAEATALKRDIDSEVSAWRASLQAETRTVSEEDVVATVSELSGIDVETVRRREPPST